MAPATAVPSAAFLEQSQARKQIAAGVCLFVSSTIAVALRIFARRTTRASLGKDDYFMITALLFTLANTTASLLSVRYGMGRHIEALSAFDLAMFQKVFFAMALSLPIAVATTKIAILFLYLRLFGNIRYFRRATIAFLVLTSLWVLVDIIATCTVCSPLQKYYLPSLPGSCGNRRLMYEIFTGVDMITDFALLLLPLPVVWHLHLSVRSRIQISIVFILGSMTCVFTAIRFASLFSTNDSDPTWDLAMVNIWSLAEPCIGIICGCLPILRPIVDRVFWACGYQPRASTNHSRDQLTMSSVTPRKQHILEQALEAPDTPILGRSVVSIFE